MKRRNLSGPVIFFLALALLLLVIGFVFGSQTFAQFEQLVLHHENNEVLWDAIRINAVYLMVFGGVVIAGVDILLILFLHQIRRTARISRETEALRRKNEAVEALNQQTQQLAHHQRLEIIGTLTSSIAHEFNNLLTPIMGYSMLALEKLPTEEELYDEILEIYNASLKAKEIISRLSDLSRKNTSTTFRAACPDDLVRRILSVATPAKPEHVEVKLDLNCWDQRIQANEIQISQMLLNLILNGFQAMGDQAGMLTMSTSYDEDDVQFQITDTGSGIPEEIRNRIFEPFFTTKETGKGTGLGLAIVAQVVEDHHGKIAVNSRVGEGTTVTVRIPRSAEIVENT